MIEPYGGGNLVNLLQVDDLVLLQKAKKLRSLKLTHRELCDLELLCVGGFSPLKTYMGQDDYLSVLNNMKLSDGRTLWPIPITLTVDEGDCMIGEEITLRDCLYNIIAIMRIEEKYEWNKDEEARIIYGTLDTRHPMVRELQSHKKYCISGELKVLNLPEHFDFVDLRLTPQQVRERLKKPNVVAFQTRNPMHRVHEELTKRAAAEANATLLLQPVVGYTKPGDIDHFTRVRMYKVLVETYYKDVDVILCLLPLAMRMAGPKEALLHAIIRRNFGANFFIVGRDHAGPGNDSFGRPFYDPYAAQQLLKEHEHDIGVKMIPFKEIVYDMDKDIFVEASDVKVNLDSLRSISGTDAKRMLEKGEVLPRWYTRPECAKILYQIYPPRHKQGFCLWFTGLSGAGKSTIASGVCNRLCELGKRFTFLDGDVVRTHLSKGLTFSSADRNTNIMRIAFVASEICKHDAIVVCAAISPYRMARDESRSMIKNFIEIFVDTPIEVCEDRDIKGLYVQAREALKNGTPMHFTGIDDPYETPLNPEVHIQCASISEQVEMVINYIKKEKFIK